MKKQNGMILPLGTRVRHESGREGVVVRWYGRHSGYAVRFDTKANSLEKDTPRVHGAALTPLDPNLHARWESLWPSFMDRKWAAL